MVILAWIIIVILFLLISNYYIYKTDSRTRKKHSSMQLLKP